MVSVDADDRPRRTVKTRAWRTAQRARSRASAKAYAALSPDEKAALFRIARRLDETDFILPEYAAEVGVTVGLLWRARTELGLAPGGTRRFA